MSKNHQPLTINYQLVLGWLYPDLMSIYGDRGNIIALTKRCEWRGIHATIKPITVDTSLSELRSSDMLFMGGAQDRQQTIVAKDLRKKKKVLSQMIEDHVPGLYICGGFQFLGKYYKEADGTVIDQLGVLDVYTENPGGKRLIGNIAIEVDGTWLMANSKETINHTLSTINPIVVGFENHGGRTRLGRDVKPLGKVIKGYGSNAEDHTEGAVYKNSIGTYLHGPILPKNPILADWLITKAIEHKYFSKFSLSSLGECQGEVGSGQTQAIKLSPLDDTIATLAHDAILKKM